MRVHDCDAVSAARPRTSNDNPYSESRFKTLKYNPSFPNRFGSIEDARAFCREFFAWYNNEHRHSGIGLMTPGVVHSGNAGQLTNQRSKTLYSNSTSKLRPAILK
jgi:putative transposase